jgi:hypothetical protein
MLIVTCFFTSCDNDYSSVLDQSVDERINENITAYRNTLIGSEYGWDLLNLSTKPELYGSFNFNFKFEENGILTTISDFKAKETSKYSVASIESPVLRFDTNSPFLFLTDPSVVNVSKGLGGDVEYYITEVTENEISLRGRVNGLEFKLVKSDGSSISQIESSYKTHQNIEKALNFAFTGMKLTGDDNVDLEFSINKSKRVVGFKYENASDEIINLQSRYSISGNKIVLSDEV